MSAADVMLTAAWFERSVPNTKRALGETDTRTWQSFASVFSERREGQKDGICVIPSRFQLEPDGRVHRLGRNVVARTAIALDIETDKATGEVPPPLDAALKRVAALGLAVVGYTSHNHSAADTRYRLIFPLSAEVAPDLPACEVLAMRLDLLGVLDKSKTHAASLFFLPSRPVGSTEQHQTTVLDGVPVDSSWIQKHAGRLRTIRLAEEARIAAEAQAAAAARREAKASAGFDRDDTLIGKIRSRLDMGSVLTGHGYDQSCGKFRHPASQSGGFGLNIAVLGGVERCYSHNAGDPLHRGNLPGWCAGVTAIDAVDVVTILDYHGDRTRALADLAKRFRLTNVEGRKAVAAVIFRKFRQGAKQEDIEDAALREGARHGMSRDEVCGASHWVASQLNRETANQLAREVA